MGKATTKTSCKGGCLFRHQILTNVLGYHITKNGGNYSKLVTLDLAKELVTNLGFKDLNEVYWVPLDTDDIHIMRALFFPWNKGISQRFIIPDIESFTAELPINQVPMPALSNGTKTLQALQKSKQKDFATVTQAISLTNLIYLF